VAVLIISSVVVDLCIVLILTHSQHEETSSQYVFTSPAFCLRRRLMKSVSSLHQSLRVTVVESSCNNVVRYHLGIYKQWLSMSPCPCVVCTTADDLCDMAIHVLYVGHQRH